MPLVGLVSYMTLARSYSQKELAAAVPGIVLGRVKQYLIVAITVQRSAAQLQRYTTEQHSECKTKHQCCATSPRAAPQRSRPQYH